MHLNVLTSSFLTIPAYSTNDTCKIYSCTTNATDDKHPELFHGVSVKKEGYACVSFIRNYKLFARHV